MTKKDLVSRINILIDILNGYLEEFDNYNKPCCDCKYGDNNLIDYHCLCCDNGSLFVGDNNE